MTSLASPTPSATAADDQTPNATITPDATDTPVETATSSPASSILPTATLTATSTPAATGSATPTETATATASLTPSSTPTPTGVLTWSASATVTPSPSATVSPALTATVTPSTSPTASTSPTLTASAPQPTPSATPAITATATPAACGNGAIDPGEECDDANAADGDGCDGSCRSELVPGRGSARTDCAHEWLTAPVTARDADGIPSARLACEDDDPTCDFGAGSGDATCTFHVALCLNVSERRFVNRRTAQPFCAPTDVAWVALKTPREADPRDAVDAANRDALETALTALGADVRRQCQPPGVRPSTVCASDVDCPRPRRCRNRFVEFVPPFGADDRCTTFAEVIVPLRHGAHGLRAGKRTLRLSVAAAAPRAARDTDVLQLVCSPRAGP